MSDEVSASTLQKVLARLVPFSMLLFFVQILDKTNVSYAALQMNEELGFSDQIYGFGAGIYFLGGFFFEVPSNLILMRVGARRWLSRIMITWGLIVVLMAWMRSANAFYSLRFLLGTAEAGLLPGVMYHLGTWVPGPSRGHAMSWVMSVSAFGAMIAGPLSTGIMQMQGILGFSGWQWVFLLEGLATVVIGLVTLRYLPEKPGQARWLDPPERQWLTDTLGRELASKQDAGMTRLARGFLDRRVLIGLVIGFLLVFCNFGTVLWLPQMVKSFGGLTNMQVGLLSGLPYACGVLAMVFTGRSSDASGDRRWHLVAGACVSALGYAGAALAPTNTLVFVGLCVAAAGMLSTFGVFWAHANDLLGGAAAAGGLAFLGAASQLGGFLGPIVSVIYDMLRRASAPASSCWPPARSSQGSSRWALRTRGRSLCRSPRRRPERQAPDLRPFPGRAVRAAPICDP
jgi:ACS family tartrate transporter-like MFS transporter